MRATHDGAASPQKAMRSIDQTPGSKPGPNVQPPLSLPALSATIAALGALTAAVVLWLVGLPDAAGACLLGSGLTVATFLGVLAPCRRNAAHENVPDDYGQQDVEQFRLAEQLISAEQDERRRLSVLLHDGPLQSLSGIALMHDVALAALENDETQEAIDIMRNALEKERDTLHTLRDLSFAIEPLVLRDRGFVSAVAALADQIERRGKILLELDGEVGEELSEKAQVVLYQTIREALTQATRRQPSRITVNVSRQADGSYLTVITDDGIVERQRRNVEAIEERARLLRGTVTVESATDEGTVIRAVLPGYVARATSRIEHTPKPAAA